MTDPLSIMNAVTRWTPEEGVPPMDDRWLKKIVALSEYAAALQDVYTARTAQYHARCQGTVRDKKRESEMISLLRKLERIESALGITYG